jgi:hypothetical protein
MRRSVLKTELSSIFGLHCHTPTFCSCSGYTIYMSSATAQAFANIAFIK